MCVIGVHNADNVLQLHCLIIFIQRDCSFPCTTAAVMHTAEDGCQLLKRCVVISRRRLHTEGACTH